MGKHTLFQVTLAVFVLIVSSTQATPACQATPEWPKGTYSLLRAETQTSCPSSWSFGDRLQDTETAIVPVIGGNTWSDPCHLMGPYTERRITWNFCTKTSLIGDNPDIDWAPGQYCIMKKGTTCPTGFEEGWVQWDDEDGFDNSNTHSGSIPEGVYNRDTLIYFCCRDDGYALFPLYLPTSQPFILFMKTPNTCQEVEGMTVRTEWFQWDGENSLIDFTKYFEGSVPFHDGRDNNHKIHFCYYS